MTHSHPKKDRGPQEAAAGQTTLRDAFAAAVLPSLCHSTLDDGGQAADVARRAYILADAMLCARDEGPAPAAEAPAQPEA